MIILSADFTNVAAGLSEDMEEQITCAIRNEPILSGNEIECFCSQAVMLRKCSKQSYDRNNNMKVHLSGHPSCIQYIYV